MLLTLTIFNTAFIILYILFGLIKLHKRFTVDQGYVWWHYGWVYGGNYFTSGKGLFRIIPLFMCVKCWTFHYKGYHVCSCRFIDAITRKGAIRKFKKEYDIEKFNLNRLHNELEDDPNPESEG